MEDIIGYVLTGGAAAAGVKLLDNLIQWLLTRRAATRDKAVETSRKTDAEKEQEMDEVKRTVCDLAGGQMIILHDRIKYLGRCYIQDGEIRLDDREDLLKMHEAYHKLGGNGNLNVLMDDVLELSLRHD